ncbi:alpha/beta hydrolase [Candidatus Nomurabacteria bacterium]|nr:alpha/beta hydrolase [Candidatus Nomurabacteria bacterium]
MKNAIIVHGRPEKEEYYSDQYPSASNFHWIPWLQKQLMIRDIKADTPEIPMAFAPEWNTWRTEFERFDVNEESVLVGHSNGAGFLVRWLSENKNVKIDKLVLVAPSFNRNEFVHENFFDFEIDPKLKERMNQITILNGLKDCDSVQKSVKRVIDEIDSVELIEFPDNEHFTADDIGVEFIELLNVILK